MNEILINNRGLSDLNPLLFGREECERGKSFGPAIRKYTLIHYVERGCGKFEKGGKSYTVRAGEAFIILPDELTYYEADSHDPWVYRWIGFDGALSEKYALLPPVIQMPSGVFPEFFTESDGRVLEYMLASSLFLMTAELFSGAKQRNHYVRRVKNYISSSYMQELRVEKIAAELCLDRRYLSRLFKEKTGLTVQDYITSVRMEEARRLLSLGISVAEAARMCGYSDVTNFSKAFKRLHGQSPAHWRK
jgi:AraC-like DNA-binding protein